MNAFPILRVSVTGQMQPRELYQFVKDKVKPRLEQVDGVSAVTIIGGQEREIRVEVDNQKLTRTASPSSRSPRPWAAKTWISRPGRSTSS